MMNESCMFMEMLQRISFCEIAYVVSVGIDDRIVSFAMGKARVAPMKHCTKPKLELTAAVTVTRLKKMLPKENFHNFSRIFMWTDSATVLQWIINNDKKQSVLVANRVAEILDSATVDHWNHIGGVENPADLATRGTTYLELMGSHWLQGILWLKDGDCISHIDQKWTNEDKQVDNQFKVATEYEAQALLGVLVSTRLIGNDIQSASLW